jgi:hypothetical protein
LILKSKILVFNKTIYEKIKTVKGPLTVQKKDTTKAEVTVLAVTKLAADAFNSNISTF